MSWFWSSSSSTSRRVVKQPEDDDDDDDDDEEEEEYEDDMYEEGEEGDENDNKDAHVDDATTTKKMKNAKQDNHGVTTADPAKGDKENSKNKDEEEEGSLVVVEKKNEKGDVDLSHIAGHDGKGDEDDDNDDDPFHASSGQLVHEIENEAQRSAMDTDDDDDDDDSDEDDDHHRDEDDDDDEDEVDSDVEKKVWSGLLPDTVHANPSNPTDMASNNRLRADSALTFGDEEGEEEEDEMGEEEEGLEDDAEDHHDDNHGDDMPAKKKKSSSSDHPSNTPSDIVPAMSVSTSGPNKAKKAEDMDEKEEDEEEDDDEVTSTQEKQSLLALAAEHDRVDILQSILTEDASDRAVLLQGGWRTTSSGITEPILSTTSTTTSTTITTSGLEGGGKGIDMTPATVNNSVVSLVILTIPPLHIAVSYGSTNATNCLLRMGADPSIRPDLTILQRQMADNKEHHRDHPVTIPNMNRFDGLSAWELVFGLEGDQDDDATAAAATKKRASWSLFGGSSSSTPNKNLDQSTPSNSNNTPKSPTAMAATSPYGRRPSSNVNRPDLAPSKREGIRHAFTAEALRCIGADEVDRLRQLLHSGMPATIDIGGRRLYDWAVEMSALACEELLRPSEAARHDEMEEDQNGVGTTSQEDSTGSTTATPSKRTAVLDRPPSAVGEDGTTTTTPEAEYYYMLNQLDELESLSKALSMCLDNLAEEVAVCSGLLLMGTGAAALASHVRSLKSAKETKLQELSRMEEARENNEDELAYWARELGEEGQRIADQVILVTPPSRNKGITNTSGGDEEDAQQQQQRRQQLKAQIAASEHKVRKLRASIEDLSDENARDLLEVERRGLSGGVRLVRGLREEIREIDFQLSEAKSADAACRTKISLIQAKIRSNAKQHLDNKEAAVASTNQDANGTNGSSRPATAEKIAKPGASTASSSTSTPIKAPPMDAVTAETISNPAAGESATEETLKTSELIESGQSTALVVRDSRNRGLLNLWQILMRIIGLREVRTTSEGGRPQPAIII